jgi:uncharacterized protein (TIGR03067 family)
LTPPTGKRRLFTARKHDGNELTGCGAAARCEKPHMRLSDRAEQDGKAADNLVGHRLSFMGHRFEIRLKDDKPLYAGAFRMNPSANPATIDFQQKNGALNRKVWKGIQAVDGDTLTTCDNAPDPKKSRPTAFEAKSGSGYVLITKRALTARMVAERHCSSRSRRPNDRRRVPLKPARRRTFLEQGTKLPVP